MALVAGSTGFSLVKGAGAALALVAVVPIFILLRRFIRIGPPTRLLGIFVGGFFFKLFILLLAIWYAVSRLGWPTVDFVVTCMAFLMALQLYESIYFFRNRGIWSTLDASQLKHNQ